MCVMHSLLEQIQEAPRHLGVPLGSRKYYNVLAPKVVTDF